VELESTDLIVRAADRLEETAVVELVDRLEDREGQLAAACRELDALRRERDGLAGELSLARRWVKLLAEEVEALEAQAQPLRGRLKRTVARAEAEPAGREDDPLPWPAPAAEEGPRLARPAARLEGRSSG